MPDILPISLADFPEDWIEERREVIAREGNAVRLATDSLNIEVKSLRADKWLRLPLPGTAPEFASHKEREFVFREIQRAEPMAKKEASK